MWRLAAVHWSYRADKQNVIQAYSRKGRLLGETLATANKELRDSAFAEFEI